ncbi:hypothetical protein D3C78_821290 [compost metagenome]
MMKPRITPIIITAAISAVILFGGWSVYHQVAVAAPLEKAVADIEGVKSIGKPVISEEQVMIDVVLESGANVRSVYNGIEKNGSDVIGDRALKLNIKTESDEQLESLWSSVLFDIAEAMETRAYSSIPDVMKDAAAQTKGVSVTTEMDETNVYITITNEASVKYVVLPRTPIQMGVWQNA